MDIKNNYFHILRSENTNYLHIRFFRNCTPDRRAVFDLRTDMKHRTVSENLSRTSTEYGLVFKTQDNSDNIDGAAAVFSPSLETDDYSESHEFDRVIPNPKVCYRVHKKTWLLAIRRQTNPVHILPLHLFNIPLLPTPWFPNQKHARISFFPPGCSTPRKSHIS